MICEAKSSKRTVRILLWRRALPAAMIYETKNSKENKRTSRFEMSSVHFYALTVPFSHAAASSSAS